MKNQEAISTLTPLLKASAEPCPVLLLGAGASFRSGVPTAAEAVKQIARRVYSERQLRGARPPERVKPSEWEPWLQSFPWFIKGDDRLAENFPPAVEHLLVPAEFRKRVILDLMTPGSGMSTGYRNLADMMMRGLVHTVLTTNFDTCLVDALKERHPHIRHIHEVNRGPGDYDQFNVYSRCQIVWLHGRAEQYSDKNAAGEVDALDQQLISLIRPLLGAPIIVIGYRGAEPSVMEGLFGQSREGRLDFPHGVYWCVRHGEALHPNVEALRRRLGTNFRLLQIEGFDELFAELSKELSDEDRYVHGRPAASSCSARDQSFDERIVSQVSIADLDMDLALSVLRQYCEKLGRAAVTRDTLSALMCEQGLLVREGDTEKVTAGAVLLFGKHPQAIFPHAVVSVTEAGKKREIYDGNLISQHRRLLEKLDGEEVNPVLKVKRRRQHEERRAYPPRVLVELLINTLVHRDYEGPEPSRIEIIPGAEIAFVNPGGLTQKLAGRVSLEDDGRFVPSASITDQRNPSLCDIFFGINAMERAGTGLIDVSKLMLEWGGASAFYHFSKEYQFKARVVRPEASAGSRIVARSNVPTGLYVLNALPLTVVPDHISIVRLKTPLRHRPLSLELSNCGTFIDRGNELWSFVPLATLTASLDAIVDREASTSAARKKMEAVPDTKRVVSWLLRKHWERFVESFKEQGLILEEGRRHRAYFEGRDEDGRTVIWNSSQRRGNRRDVVKKRADGPRTWFENEGFGYEVIEVGGIWCVRIKPFYMFTGRNARTPLPSFARTGKATSRMKFDRNKNVEADLVFWSSFLGRGSETINVGGLHVNDLILEASFLTVEVPEIGLITDDAECQNRMSA